MQFPTVRACRAILLLAALASAGRAAVHTDVAYDDTPGAAPARTLDLHVPDAATAGAALPVVVYVHGGGWTGGSKARVGAKPAWLNARGFLLVSVDYRLLPDGRHPAAAEDLAAALAWLTAHVADYGGDPAALFLLGHSSGGHLISLVASDESLLAAHGLDPGRLRGVIALDASAFEIDTLVRLLPTPSRQRYLEVFGTDPMGWRRASPAFHLAAGEPTPPFLLLVAGAGDTTELLNRRFAAGLEAAQVDVTLEVFGEETHGSINAALGTAGHAPTAALAAFLDRLLEP